MYYCNAQQAYSEEYQKKYLPKKEKKFVLSKQLFVLNDTAIISPNNVYVNVLIGPPPQGNSFYTYMRFFNDGKVFVSFPYLRHPTIEEFNDMTYGKYGRYIVKDGEIKIELYMNRQHGMMYMFAKPVSKGIQFYKTTGRGIGQILKVSKTTDGGFYQKFFLNKK